MASNSFLQMLIAALLSSAVVSTILGLVFRGYVTKVDTRVKSQYSWKEQSVTELLAPLFAQFERTSLAFKRWSTENHFLEMKVIKTGNEIIRDLLLDKVHLIPPDLRDDASKLVEHYDVWLEKFEEIRVADSPKSLSTPFIFAGPEGYPFPSEAEENFKKKFVEYWNDLYGN